MDSRRLAVLCSNLRPLSPTPAGSAHTPLSLSHCVSEDKDNQQNDCVFCKIIRGESPAYKLYEDDTCLCILDTSPLIHGHSLIIPKSHFSCLEATPPSQNFSKFTAVSFEFYVDSYNLLANNGEAAGQVVFHTHIHLIPRKARDYLWTTQSLQRCPLNFNHRASQLVNCVREQLMNISEDGKGQESTLSSN